MKNTMTYRGYTGTVEFSEEDGLFFGQVLGIRSMISYEGKDAESLRKDFREAIDYHLEVCEAEGIDPEVPYKGTFNVRVGHELHEKVALVAVHNNMTLNACVVQALEQYCAAMA